MRTASLENLKRIANRLAEFVAPRDAHYDASWKKRGGQGAFFTVVRHMDRLQAIAERGSEINTRITSIAAGSGNPGDPLRPVLQKTITRSLNDIFAIWESEDQAGKLYEDGTLSACVQDIACYMLLIIEEMEARKAAENYRPASAPSGVYPLPPSGVPEAMANVHQTIPVDAGGNPWLIGTFVSAIVLPIVMLAGIAVSRYGKAKSDIGRTFEQFGEQRPNLLPHTHYCNQCCIDHIPANCPKRFCPTPEPPKPPPLDPPPQTPNDPCEVLTDEDRPYKHIKPPRQT